mgnify:CR=1 FL=1
MIIKSASSNVRIAVLTAVAAVFSSAVAATLAPPALAESKEMTEGVFDFKNGDYKSAENNFGLARQAEFSNPKFHYYLANTYIHVNKKDLAIQEFRIAFALAPEQEVGKLSKQALGYLGVESEARLKTNKPPVIVPLTAKEKAMEDARNSLKNQVEQAKNGVRSQRERDALEMARIQSDALAKTQKELEERIAKGKGSKESLKLLEQMKRDLETHRSSLERGNSHAQEIQKSADNLQTLLDEKKTIGSPKLSPVGTNLYIRNYFDDGKGAKNPPTSQTHGMPSTANPTVNPAGSPAGNPAVSPAITPGVRPENHDGVKAPEKNSSNLQKKTL